MVDVNSKIKSDGPFLMENFPFLCCRLKSAGGRGKSPDMYVRF